MDELKYYNSPISLEQAEQYIQSGLVTAARAYVANGYYLRRIRDDKLFEESGYQNFEDYVRGKYNKDKGWASKCIKVNQQLSDGGDSPVLSKQYLEYSTYQLVELAYMTEEQREEADPEMTVNQLKQIRKPEEVVEPEKSCDVTTSEQEEEQDQEPEELQDRTAYVKEQYRLQKSFLYPFAVWLIKNHKAWFMEDYMNRVIKVDRSEGQLKSYLGAYPDGSSSYGFPVDSETYYAKLYDNRIVISHFTDGGTVVVDGTAEWFYLSASVQVQWNVVAMEEIQEERKHETQLQADKGYYNPDDEKEVDESYSYAGIPKATDRHVTMFARLFVQDNANRLIYGGMAIGITDERIIEMLKLFYHSQKLLIIDNDVQVTVCAEIIEFSRGDEDLGICLFQKFSNYVRKQIDEYVADRLAEEDKEVSKNQQSVIHQDGNTFNSTPTSCPYREGYSCTVLTENKSIPGNGNNCGSSCCWSCKFHGSCKLECNASSGRDGSLPEYDAAWFVKEWSKRVPEELKGVLKECKEQENNSDRAKAVQKYLAPYGYHGTGCGEYDFTYHGFAGGIDLKIGKVDTHLKYGRFVQELMNLFPGFEEPVREAPEGVPKEDENVPESSENVIDGVYVEIKEFSGVKAFDVTILNELIKREEETLEQMAGIWKEKQPLIYTKHAMMFEAYNLLKDNNAKVEQKPEKQEQPELPILKNNDQRAAFIDAYETWPIWIETKETGERYYRYDLSEKVAIVVKVYWKHSWESYKESKDYEYGAQQYYLMGVKSEWRKGKNVYVEDESRTFYECGTNRSALVEYLKDFQKSK
nr:hypothetical protein [uncultured Clostridium sp.]